MLRAHKIGLPLGGSQGVGVVEQWFEEVALEATEQVVEDGVAKFFERLAHRRGDKIMLHDGVITKPP